MAVISLIEWVSVWDRRPDGTPTSKNGRLKIHAIGTSVTKKMKENNKKKKTEINCCSQSEFPVHVYNLYIFHNKDFIQIGFK